MSNQAVVYLYDDDVTTGHIIRFGRNLSLDPSVEALVDIDDGVKPDPTKPLWKQRVDDGVIGPYSDDDEEEARKWLHTRFQAGKRNHMFAHETALILTDNQEVSIGMFVSDGRNVESGGDEGGAKDRVFGVQFWWRSPLLPDVIVPSIYAYGVDEDAAETVKKPREFRGRPSNSKDDSSYRREIWKMVIYQKEPKKLFKWLLKVSAPGLPAGETCELQALTLSTGRRGAD